MLDVAGRLWRTLVSVQFALLILFLIATTSIIGTFIQQNQGNTYYIDTYGSRTAEWLDRLQLTNMYSSWWFIALLLLFCSSLILCSIDRWPATRRRMKTPLSPTEVENADKNSATGQMFSELALDECCNQIRKICAEQDWPPLQLQQTKNSLFLYTHRGAWTRLAVYTVHISILIILAGALIGTYAGFKAYVFLPEGRSTSQIFLQGTREPVPLGYDLWCELATTTRYPDGSVQEYRANLMVDDRETGTQHHQSVTVNHPMSFRGVSFYLGEFYPLEEYLVVISDITNNREQAFRAPPHQFFYWQESSARMSLEEFTRDSQGHVQLARILFAGDEVIEPEDFWVGNNRSVQFEQNGKNYRVSVRQLTSVLLLANKDPGVPVVYSGFLLLLFSLPVCFLLSHQRIWFRIRPLGTGCIILIGGSSNKHPDKMHNSLNLLRDKVAITINTTDAEGC